MPAPIDGAMVAAPATSDGEYTLNITSGLPSGCAQFDEFRMERDGNEFMVDVTNLMPNPNQLIACTAIYSYHESEIPLGSRLTAGEAYSRTINRDLAISFVAQDEKGLAMVGEVSPIAQVGISEEEDGYLLSIGSRLPVGSSCSRFDGYQINGVSMNESKSPLLISRSRKKTCRAPTTCRQSQPRFPWATALSPGTPTPSL